MSNSTSFAGSFLASGQAADPFALLRHSALPWALRNESAGMSWSSFEDTYAPSNGRLRLGNWSATKSGLGMWDFEATLGIAESIRKVGARAPGPVGAMTSMLYDVGFSIEILSFHRHGIRYRAQDDFVHRAQDNFVHRAQDNFVHRTVTFLLCESGGTRLWAMGIDESQTESTLRAMISGANRLQAA
ncbi:2-isopropylmalate synthase [Rhodococcus sp. WMMA185]|uniref:2-isopropylmalate synthase n=1 Tax=Rhodococcus sp. WMMA185 TaxID=679318 RepID=UPI0008787D21|nr:2-isopropylmalate synthase [Rhodococcus sp. WMMA185]AOW92492.1 2-isopropylmalate synthase [Rhodococcus sp. WMMA185]